MLKKEGVKAYSWHSCCSGGFSCFGAVILLIGVVWLLRDMGIISMNVNMWSFVFIIAGLCMIFSRFSKGRCC